MRILFQGDSITDAGRNTSNGSTVSIGQGYAMLVSARLTCDRPNDYEFLNRGISGNRIVDVYSRIKADCWNLKPDVLSVLIGVNDVWHEIMCDNGVDCERFERVYDMLLGDTVKRFPDIKLMLLEPFVLHGTATDEKFDRFYSEVRKNAAVCERLAKKYGAVFVTLQNAFDEASAGGKEALWLADGVHPTPAGHQLIADRWLEAFKRL